MSKEGQAITKAVYHDPEIIAGYIEKHTRNPKLYDIIDAMVQDLPGNRILDLGCGPGHDSYRFAEHGFDVTGVDYSSEMIEVATQLRHTENPPHFQVGDMREVGVMFPENTFDAAWVSASLLHIPQDEAPQVLRGIHTVVKNGGKVYIGVKGGEQGENLVHEGKYGKPMTREFTFWEKDNLQQLLEEQGFTVENFLEQIQEGDNPTTWLNFFVTVNK